MDSAMTMTHPPAPRSTTSLVASRALPPSRALASVRTPVALVPPADPATDAALRSLRSRLESLGGNRYALFGAFPDADRARLERRADELAAYLEPADPDEILRAVGMLRTLKGEIALEGEARRAVVSAHVALLGHVPAWAINAVCQAFMRSRDKFAPDPGAIADACEAHLVPVRAELRRIEHVLSAETEAPVTEVERDRVAALARDFAAEMAAANRVDLDHDGPDVNERDKALAELAALEAAARSRGAEVSEIVEGF